MCIWMRSKCINNRKYVCTRTRGGCVRQQRRVYMETTAMPPHSHYNARAIRRQCGIILIKDSSLFLCISNYTIINKGARVCCVLLFGFFMGMFHTGAGNAVMYIGAIMFFLKPFGFQVECQRRYTRNLRTLILRLSLLYFSILKNNKRFFIQLKIQSFVIHIFCYVIFDIRR